MEYRVLGGTGVRVSTHCLGAMMFGPSGNDDSDDCVRIIHAALDGGINFIDTADVYSRGISEEIVGRALRGRRDDVVLATKVHGRMGQGINESGNSRLWITREVEASLRRLGTDHIDLYQLHRPDPRTDLEESQEALTDLIRQGKVRYAGTSAFPAWQIVEAHWTSERRGLARFRCEQSSYSILVRDRELDVFPVAQRYGMGVIAYSPLAGGMLSGKYRRGQDPAPDSRIGRAHREGRLLERYDFSRPEVQRKLEVVERLERIADDAGVGLTHLAVAFTLAHPAITSAIRGPRPGPRRPPVEGHGDHVALGRRPDPNHARHALTLLRCDDGYRMVRCRGSRGQGHEGDGEDGESPLWACRASYLPQANRSRVGPKEGPAR